jgi:hypothetical protein
MPRPPALLRVPATVIAMSTTIQKIHGTTFRSFFMTT